MSISLPGRLRLGSVSTGEQRHVLAAARSAELTYGHVGSTLAPASRSGEFTDSIDVGFGQHAFASARAALQSWVPQRAIGAQIVPADQAVELGATVLLVVPRGPVFFIAVDRVVAVIDERRKYAFAYGTLPGHPERGEESFSVDWLDDDSVRVAIRVQAESSTVVGRLAGPVTRWLQHAALRRYLQAIADVVARGQPSTQGA